MHNADEGRDEFDNDEWETHATVLDKMLAWEKKLYEEVKVGILRKNHSYHLISSVPVIHQKHNQAQFLSFG